MLWTQSKGSVWNYRGRELCIYYISCGQICYVAGGVIIYKEAQEEHSDPVTIAEGRLSCEVLPWSWDYGRDHITYIESK